MGNLNIVELKNVSKKYTIFHDQPPLGQTTLVETLAMHGRRFWKRMGGHKRRAAAAAEEKQTEEFWALKDISLAIEEGDRFGIIGRNGAGKSTLLKLLSRIIMPSDGEIFLRGKISSLLEVGTGFHPELTGRENVFLNGAILGMSKREIARKFDEIVEFAEIEKFLDTPVKRYSSGMYTRLGFSIAAYLDPQVLVLDEVLAVGDAPFQAKCIKKMRELALSGRTIIFVSHNTHSLLEICNKGIYLENGRQIEVGSIEKCIKAYEQKIQGNLTS
ncbi:ABC transporter ATP-binding protein [Neochlamydia sp. S13]|uniref:ABC transporter ATP-binding protein n=1 Tax=Neochlamydia sp. S13 TaxID=1353976 RepID=UPI00069417C2|nr:ABC transporter ATP-binding protein [Neochlamydia sp. S13]BBI18106.1 ABC transporter ATP-binding protein [Neochlamydia sp. S13]